MMSKETEQTETEEETEEEITIDDVEARISDIAFHTAAAIESIHAVLKKFKKDHYTSEGDELDELLEEVKDSFDEINELA